MYGQAKITHDNSTQGALLDQGFWIEVTALANKDPHGFIAFDNFEVISDSDCTIMPPGAYPTQCKDDEFRCFDDNTCISNANVCDFEYNCGDGSDETVCPSDFDFNDCQNLTGQIMCYWTEEQVDNLEWDIKTENETKNLPHGPKVDIDDNTRYYLNIKTRHF